MQQLKTVAVIPARGGSKEIPKKNLQKVGGIPLVGRTILAAKGATTLDRVFVSTDSGSIADAASQYGAEIIVRPNEFSGDGASSEVALLHAVESLMQQNIRVDVLVMLQCTSPFTTSAAIDYVVKSLALSHADMAFSAREEHGFLWGVDAKGFGFGINHDPMKPRVRRQDLPIQFRETGAIYAMRTEAFLQAENRFCGKTLPVQVPLPVLEIDSFQDLDLAVALATQLGL